MNISHPSWVNTPVVNICLGPVTVHYREVSLYANLLLCAYNVLDYAWKLKLPFSPLTQFSYLQSRRLGFYNISNKLLENSLHDVNSFGYVDNQRNTFFEQLIGSRKCN